MRPVLSVADIAEHGGGDSRSNAASPASNATLPPAGCASEALDIDLHKLNCLCLSDISQPLQLADIQQFRQQYSVKADEFTLERQSAGTLFEML